MGITPIVQLADLQEKLRNLEGGGKRRRKQEVDSWIAQATKLINDFPTVKQRAIHGPCWNAWEKYRTIDRVKKMSEAVKDAKNDLRNIGELAVVDMGESTIPSQVDENMKALKRQVTQLSSQAQDIETTLMNLEQGGKKKRKLEVKVWLEQVEEIKNDFETSGKTSLENVQTMRDAQLEKLRDDGKNFGELTLSGKTSSDNLKKLYGWLEDDKVSSIGVYGMGGVGKTTLMRHGFKFDDKNEDHRATILQQHLVGKKTVLILDDVWKFIDLEKLGDPHRIEGCKFIITSRSSEVCRQIGCQNFFKVDVFNEEEAWSLFKQILLLYDHIVVSNAIEEHAKSLAKKCGGLPLALKTVAASMRGVNDDHVWRNAVKNFQNASQLETLENNVFQKLEFSYNRLNDQKCKKCFPLLLFVSRRCKD
nr:NBS-LRR type disease resistance protein [Ipomoea batatas]